MPRFPAVAVAWFRREDYERIREMSDDAMQPSFEAWEAKMNELLAELGRRGTPFEKVVVDPDELLAFAGGAAIDSKKRADFAAVALHKKRMH